MSLEPEHCLTCSDVLEYTLEIEDDLEFEIDGRDIEQDSDTEDEDDDEA